MHRIQVLPIHNIRFISYLSYTEYTLLPEMHSICVFNTICLGFPCKLSESMLQRMQYNMYLI
jgi:hypothetical protein